MRLETVQDKVLMPPKFEGDLEKFAKDTAYWMQQAAYGFWQMDRNLTTVVNGNVELPSVLGKSLDGTNVLMGYIPLYYAAADATTTPAIEIRHGLDRPPRGWIWFPNTEGAVMDQILSSELEDPLVTGYPTAQVASALVTPSEWTVKGVAAASNGWIDNGVRAGDQIKVSIVIPCPLLASAEVKAADLSVVVGNASAAFKTNAKPGWDIRFTAVGTGEWHKILAVRSDTELELQGPYLGAIAPGSAYEIRAHDQEWRDVVDVVVDPAPGGDEIYLDPAHPGTEVPVGSIGCQYVIRRPPNFKTMWVRIISTDPVCGAVGVF